MPSILSWIPAIISILATLVTTITAYTYLRVKVDDLIKSEEEGKLKAAAEYKDLRESLQDAVKELTTAVNLLKMNSAEQAVINKFSAGLLSSLNDKVDKNIVDIGGLNASMKILTSKVEKL